MSDIKQNLPTEEEIEFRPTLTNDTQAKKHDGTVQLTCEAGVILIPSPSDDPRDPLNIPLWHKLLILTITCMCKIAFPSHVSQVRIGFNT